MVPSDDAALVRRAKGWHEVARLRREAETLAAARHPGVVELIAFDDGGDVAELRVAGAGPPLADRLPLPPEELAGVAAVVATTLADLHELGIVHGQVDVAHVVLDGTGRPLLHGFGSGGRVGDLAPGRSGPLSPADDVEGLGRLLVGGLGLPEAPADPWTDLRGRLAARPVSSWQRRAAAIRSRRGPTGDRLQAEALASLAHQALDPDPGRRPSAAEVAAAVHDRVPLARLPGTSPVAAGQGPSPAAPRRRPSRRRWTVALGLAGAVAAGSAGALAVGGGGRTDGAGTNGSVATGSVATLPARPPTTTGTTLAALVWPTTTTTGAPGRPCPDVDSPMRADLDGDGCDEPVAFADGVVEAGGARYAAGSAGDLAATGDWDCDGLLTLALYRPSTGGVFVFDDWAGSGRPLAARRAGVVTDGVALEGGGDRDCAEMVVVRADGSRQAVPGARR